jgi:hypothetical protein
VPFFPLYSGHERSPLGSRGGGYGACEAGAQNYPRGWCGFAFIPNERHGRSLMAHALDKAGHVSLPQNAAELVAPLDCEYVPSVQHVTPCLDVRHC